MEKLSSHPTSSSATTSASVQPTYTTAGTIYNPSSSQPLQPPARRGRATKWTSGHPHTELSLFPRSLLAGLAIKPAFLGRSSSTLQQYTPLQQNNDRAVSPLSESEHAALNMSIQPPRMRSGNTPTPVSFLMSDKDDDKDKKNGVLAVDELGGAVHDAGDGNGDDEDDKKYLAALKSMTYSSLQNLSKYPNPTQRQAHHQVSVKVEPDFGSLLAHGRVCTPPASLLRQDEADMEGRMGLLRPAQVDISALLDPPHAPTRLLPTARLPSPVSSTELDAVPASTVLATGPGAPRPLTAGPPGHRQYRRSTFESTLKALGVEDQSRVPARDDDDGLAAARRVLAVAGIDVGGVCVDPLAPAAVPCNHPTATPNPPSAISLLVEGSEPDVAPPRLHAGCFGSVADPDPALDLSVDHWRNPSPLRPGRYVPGTDRLSEAAVEARNRALEQKWYEGSDLMGMSAPQVVEESTMRRHKYVFGAIGDGRPKKAKTEYEPMSVEEACNTPVADHAKPLVVMALASLVRQADEKVLKGPFAQFETPEPGYCDPTAEGRKSFFSESTT
ncbi:hypothetical protein CDD83_99 [Cordyceps sp. RAO-2017]|nr:hypothetical protein CDD83_99 [Cordyceps sp. RAO-2017]